MIPNSKVFCNTPWFEVHVYWDGSLGICCQEHQTPYHDSDKGKYNIQHTSLKQWFNSDPVKNLRLRILNHRPLTDYCRACIFEEEHSNTSRRHKSNQKSVIFTRTNFSESFEQSPNYDYFKFSFDNQGETQTLPVDFHIDLGNYCNLACKMCGPKASSRIAAQHVKWGIVEDKKYIGSDWTKNDEAWNRFLLEIVQLPVKNIHFMGGETMITDRFHEFLDFMIQRRRFDISFSFVTNGTIFDQELMQKLSMFNRVGIEVSIESLTEHNAYQRQGTDTQGVLSNIEKYRQWCNNDQISLTMRPAISALTIGSYHTLIRFCLDNQYLIKSLIVTNPRFLAVDVLPKSVRDNYRKYYHSLLDEYTLNDLNVTDDFNESDPNQYRKIARTYIDQVLKLLEQPEPDDIDLLQSKLVEHCKKWDQIYRYNACELYPELKDLFLQHGY